MSTSNYGPGVTTLKLRGITFKQTVDGFSFEIHTADLIPVLNTLKNKKGIVRGRISPLVSPSDHVSHLAFAVLPYKNIEDETSDNSCDQERI